MSNSYKIFSSKLILAISLIVSGLVIQGCGSKNFSVTNGTSAPFTAPGGNENDNVPGVKTDTGGPTCREQLNQITVPIKVYFIVDVSGSNALSSDGVPPTDKNKTIRGGSIQSFVNTYSAKPNFQWGFEVFSGTNAQVLINDASGNPLFGDSASMNMALGQFSQWQDDGATPYAVALNQASQVLSSDLSKSSPDTKYVFVFLSDGMPTPSISNSKLQQLVSGIVNQAPGRVSFNTIYYGQSSQDSYDRLNMMAQVGGGNFLDTNRNSTGSSFLISDLVIVPGVNCK